MQVLTPYYMGKYISIITSITALILSVIAVCVAAWRSPDLAFDYQGVIVGVLSLLVTALIGWQIFTLFDIKRLHADIANISYDMWQRSEKNLAEYHTSVTLMYMARDDKSQQDIINMYLSGLSAILHLGRLKEYQSASALVSPLIAAFESLESHRLSASVLQNLNQILKTIPDKDKINSLDVLSAHLTLLSEKSI